VRWGRVGEREGVQRPNGRRRQDSLVSLLLSSPISTRAGWQLGQAGGPGHTSTDGDGSNMLARRAGERPEEGRAPTGLCTGRRECGVDAVERPLKRRSESSQMVLLSIPFSRAIILSLAR
jgi:hypothetical protein